MDDKITINAEDIREVLDVLAGWTGNSMRMSKDLRIAAAIGRLNRMLREVDNETHHR